MQEIKTYADITRAANSMQKDREIQADLKRQEPLIDTVHFEQSFREIFEEDGDERDPKPVNVNQAMFDAGFKQSDF